jgi:hypothetical protein
VGQVAMRNFGLVRDRLKSIVLRADVGVGRHGLGRGRARGPGARRLLGPRARAWGSPEYTLPDGYMGWVQAGVKVGPRLA